MYVKINQMFSHELFSPISYIGEQIVGHLSCVYSLNNA